MQLANLDTYSFIQMCLNNSMNFFSPKQNDHNRGWLMISTWLSKPI